jgi:hypothetical protein
VRKKAIPGYPVFNLHEVLPFREPRENIDEVIIPDIDETNLEISSLSPHTG